MRYSGLHERDDRRDQRLLSVIFYEGPWERLSNLAYGLRADNSLRWDIPADPKGWRRVLGGIGDWTDRRDRDWREKFINRGTKPHRRWERRVPDEGSKARSSWIRLASRCGSRRYRGRHRHQDHE